MFPSDFQTKFCDPLTVFRCISFHQNNTTNMDTRRQHTESFAQIFRASRHRHFGNRWATARPRGLTFLTTILLGFGTRMKSENADIATHFLEKGVHLSALRVKKNGGREHDRKRGKRQVGDDGGGGFHTEHVVAPSVSSRLQKV